MKKAGFMRISLSRITHITCKSKRSKSLDCNQSPTPKWGDANYPSKVCLDAHCLIRDTVSNRKRSSNLILYLVLRTESRQVVSKYIFERAVHSKSCEYHLLRFARSNLSSFGTCIGCNIFVSLKEIIFELFGCS